MPAPSLEERIETVRKHLKFSLEWKGPKQGIFEMRRHYTNYFRGFQNFKPIRMQLVEAANPEQVYETLESIPDLMRQRDGVVTP